MHHYRVGTLRFAHPTRCGRCRGDAAIAAIALSSSHIGLVIVCDESGAMAGVVSKSDLVRHLALGRAAEAPVTTQMSGDIVSCTPADDLHATWKIMAARNLQNVPVLNADSKPLGV
jgi:CBS domain-containing protein